MSKTAGVVGAEPKGKLRAGVVPVSTRIEWREYFKDFCQRHGGANGPVPYGKALLLFPDGWIYSATDHQGPEREPPEDPVELNRLGLYYWGRLRSMVRKEVKALERQQKSFEEMQRSHGGKLPIKATVFDPETGKFRTENDAEAVIEGRLIDLRSALSMCDERLTELKAERRPFNGRRFQNQG